jgi:hypothetical protein
MKFNISSIGSALGDALFDHSAADAEKTETPVAAAPSSSISQSIRGNAPTTSTPILNGAVDPGRVTDFVTKFRAKLALSPNAVTIQSFLTIAESLEDAIKDEGGRFRAALKTLAKTQNITQAQLAEAFNAMLNVIELEHGKIIGAIKAQTEKEVTTRENSITGINNQIEELSKQRDQLSTQVIEQRAEIGVMQTSLDTATQQVTAEINDSLNKLKIYSPMPSSASTAK